MSGDEFVAKGVSALELYRQELMSREPHPVVGVRVQRFAESVSGWILEGQTNVQWFSPVRQRFFRSLAERLAMQLRERARLPVGPEPFRELPTPKDDVVSAIAYYVAFEPERLVSACERLQQADEADHRDLVLALVTFWSNADGSDGALHEMVGQFVARMLAADFSRGPWTSVNHEGLTNAADEEELAYVSALTWLLTPVAPLLANVHVATNVPGGADSSIEDQASGAAAMLPAPQRLAALILGRPPINSAATPVAD